MSYVCTQPKRSQTLCTCSDSTLRRETKILTIVFSEELMYKNDKDVLSHSINVQTLVGFGLRGRSIPAAVWTWSVSAIVSQYSQMLSNLIRKRESSSFEITGKRWTLLMTTCGVYQHISCTTKY